MAADPAARLSRLLDLHTAIRDRLRAVLARGELERNASTAREDGAGDTIFALDLDAEEVLLPFCERWGRSECFRLVAEGLDPEGRVFGTPGASGPEFVLIADPIDGTRGLMFDKRPGWSLAALAPERGPATALADLYLAAMTELPISRQHRVRRITAVRGGGARGFDEDLLRGSITATTPRPSRATTLRRGFASVVNFFPGGKERTARLEERFLERALGPWDPSRCEVYTDQYICSGGQLAELAFGHDRFVLDVRPLVHRALGVTRSLCARPYDLCTALCAQEAGCIVTAPDGTALDAPLDTSTNVAFVGYANRELAARLQPLLTESLRAEGLL